MKSDRTSPYAPYLGVDLSSRYAESPRPIDVCALTPTLRGGLRAEFWHWYWDGPDVALDVAPIRAEVAAARCVLVDGPQALAGRGRRVRVSERLCRTAGKTPDHMPGNDGPYAAFLRSSVEWFAAMHAAGIAVSPPGAVGGIGEFYPGEGWSRLSHCRLPRKTSAVGRKVRLDWLRRFGVQFDRPATLSHDALDACLGALVAAAADAAVPGMSVETVGLALQRGPDLQLREGPIVLPCVPSHHAE